MRKIKFALACVVVVAIIVIVNLITHAMSSFDAKVTIVEYSDTRVEVVFSWERVAGAYSYVVYLDDVRVSQVYSPKRDYTLLVFPGKYRFKFVAVDKNGDEILTARETVVID